MKRGSAELLILALLEERERHGYDIGKQIDERSDGTITFHITSLYPTLYRLEAKGMIEGRWVEKAGAAAAPLLPPDAGRPRHARAAAIDLAELREGDQSGGGDQACVTWLARRS